MASACRTGTAQERYAYQREKVAARLARKAERSEIATARAIDRDPCVGCAVPAHRHDEHGCKQYIPRR